MGFCDVLILGPAGAHKMLKQEQRADTQNRPGIGIRRGIMDCAACGAPIGRHKEFCVICGGPSRQSDGPPKARQAEAAAYEDLAATLEPDESLMGIIRGRVMGGWRIRALMNP